MKKWKIYNISCGAKERCQYGNSTKRAPFAQSYKNEPSYLLLHNWRGGGVSSNCLMACNSEKVKYYHSSSTLNSYIALHFFLYLNPIHIATGLGTLWVVVGYSIYMQGNRMGTYFGARNIVNKASNRATNIVNIVVVVVVVKIVEAVISMKNIIWGKILAIHTAINAINILPCLFHSLFGSQNQTCLSPIIN